MRRHEKLQLLLNLKLWHLNIKLELYNVILLFPTTFTLYMNRAAAQVKSLVVMLIYCDCIMMLLMIGEQGLLVLIPRRSQREQAIVR